MAVVVMRRAVLIYCKLQIVIANCGKTDLNASRITPIDKFVAVETEFFK